jgi:hypothetical protein
MSDPLPDHPFRHRLPHAAAARIRATAPWAPRRRTAVVPATCLLARQAFLDDGTRRDGDRPAR